MKNSTTTEQDEGESMDIWTLGFDMAGH